MGNGLEFFGEDDIGDKDGDGMPEILDPWKNPIEFVRWPVGLSYPVRDFSSILADKNFSTLQTPPKAGETFLAADPLDYLHVDPRWGGAVEDDPFALFPLIVSAGPDGAYDIIGDHQVVLGTDDAAAPGPLQYSTTGTVTTPNDPYYTPVDTMGSPLNDMNGNPLQRMGEPADVNGDNRPDKGYWDNITNHFEDIN
jgi:hypothetical protein